jgi:hypothetical protein
VTFSFLGLQRLPELLAREKPSLPPPTFKTARVLNLHGEAQLWDGTDSQALAVFYLGDFLCPQST